jgi:hypothetical protein
VTQPVQWRKSPRPDQEIVTILRQLLIAAQNGSVRSLAVVAVNPMLELETATAGITDEVRRRLIAGGLIEVAVNLSKK